MYINSKLSYVLIDNFRYVKIQSQTIDLSTTLLGINTDFVHGAYSPEPHVEVYCFRLDFSISKLTLYRIRSHGTE